MPRPTPVRAARIPSAPAVAALALLSSLLACLFAARPALASVPCSGEVQGAGNAYYYTYTPGTGACSFTGDDTDALVAAMNPVDFAGSAICGRWVRVTGPLGSVTVRIIDLSPWLAAGEIDLSATAFAMIGEPWQGVVPVTWETVASPLAETISIVTKDGSNPYWLGLQARHHRYGIASLEYLGSSGYVTIPRESYNYFVVTGMPGVSLPLAAPITVRLTDVHGQQLVIGGLAPNASWEFSTTQQFPACQDYTSGAPLPGAGQAVLLPPSPNPFNPRTTVAFELPARGPATLRVFDASGRAVATLLDGQVLEEGRHALAWDGRDDAGRPAPGGLYLLRLEAAGGVQVRKAALLK